ncbi:MAG TPA: DUF5666 domain-containing protein, partial [Ktedonobacterales bacterium]|nr:DUF5666 domain-containing protein [Ktedonobacterales bacterium]
LRARRCSRRRRPLVEARFFHRSRKQARQARVGQCDTYTVSSMSGQTIAAKAADGSTVTIHTSSSTKYTKGGQSASASAVTAGSQIHVQGQQNSDGGINATQIDVR